MLRVSCLGVFDTVGALGVPLEAFIRANRERYEFHDVELSSITRVNLHALAVDENRWPFQATVWRKPRFKKINTVVEQTWFAGSHADVGGGYIREGTRNNNRY
jgi:myosin-crossreactive antigen